MAVKKIVSYGIIFCCFNVNAQQQVRTLKVGDKVPDIELSNIINYPGEKIRLSDFRGKLIILDFWNVACTPCIAAFPKMEKIQKKFDGKVQIFLVNIINPLEKLRRVGFPEKHISPIIRETKLPFVFDLTKESDKIGKSDFAKLFDHGGEPYHVWIDQDGIIRATTMGHSTTEEKVQEFLDGKDVSLSIAHRAEELYDYAKNGKYLPGAFKSILRPQNELILNNLEYSSFFTKNLFMKGLGGGIIDSGTKKRIGVRYASSILNLFKRAYSAFTLPDNCVVLNVDNPQDFIEPDDEIKKGEWWSKNSFCYELKLPASRIGEDQNKTEVLFKRFLQQDLERLTGVTGKIEKRNVKCLILTDLRKGKRLHTSGGEELIEQTMNEFILQNLPIEGFITYFRSANRRPGDLLLLNETGYSFNDKIDMHIKCALNDISAVKKELARYGLTLIEAEREMEVLVLNQTR